MDELQKKILALIKKSVPDINEDKAADLVLHITSEEVGVRSEERLYDLPLEVLSLKVPVCDAVKLHRSWQSKFRPDRIPLREVQNQAPATYRVKWEQVPRRIINDLEAGEWPSKEDRCLLIRLVVSDILAEDSKISRRKFDDVAKSMVAKYPHALHDRNGRLTDSKYIEQKLKFRYDEEMRAFSVKTRNESPNIPEAHGCVRWRVKITPAERVEMETSKQTMAEIFHNTLVKDWPWEEIERLLLQTYPLQREDINGQMQKKSRRARGTAGQEETNWRKTTAQLTEEWPLLFHSRGILLHFKELTKVDWLEKLSEFQEKYEPTSFIKFLSTLKNLETSSTRKKFKRAVKYNTCKDPDLLAIVLMLTEYYGENKEAIIIEIESTTKIHEVEDLDGLELPATPCLLSLGPAFKARRFFFTVDSSVVSSVKAFKQGLSLLFCSYFVLNIKYAEDAGNTLDFLQRVVAKIEPERGTKMRKRNYKQPLSERLQTLLDKHANWQRKQGSDENETNPDNPGTSRSGMEVTP